MELQGQRRGDFMKKITVVYSPQCPWNQEFLDLVRNFLKNFDVEYEEIDSWREFEKVERLLKKNGIGFDKNLFFSVFVDDKIVTSSPPAIEKIVEALGEKNVF